MDRLVDRERLLALGGPGLADYAFDLEQRVAELDRKLAEPIQLSPDQCPYPLFPGSFGPHHHEFLGRIDAPGLGDYPWLNIIRCAACRNVTLEEPVLIG